MRKEKALIRTTEKKSFLKLCRAGKRTYFFDVKATRKNDYYLTITESKKKFENDEDFILKNTKFFFTKKTLRNLLMDYRK